jgi:hypothetical protein
MVGRDDPNPAVPRPPDARGDPHRWTLDPIPSRRRRGVHHPTRGFVDRRDYLEAAHQRRLAAIRGIDAASWVCGRSRVRRRARAAVMIGAVFSLLVGLAKRIVLEPLHREWPMPSPVGDVLRRLAEALRHA